MNELDKFLEESNSTPNCKTCGHPRVSEINKVCKQFADKLAKGETAIPWTHFVDRFLKPNYDYNLKYRALLCHVRNCRGMNV